MKKNLPLFSFLLLSLAGANAQEMTTTTAVETTETVPYDRWSIELNGGVNKPTRAMTSGYYTETLNFFHAD